MFKKYYISWAEKNSKEQLKDFYGPGVVFGKKCFSERVRGRDGDQERNITHASWALDKRERGGDGGGRWLKGLKYCKRERKRGERGRKTERERGAERRWEMSEGPYKGTFVNLFSF